MILKTAEMMRPFYVLVLMVLFCQTTRAEPRRIEVFVALCDNKTQAIAKVNPRIGDGDKPDSNLYWGCSDGLRSYFKKSSKWSLKKSEKNVTPTILERLTFTHSSYKDVTLVANAYKGSEMKKCLLDFFTSAGKEKDPELQLVAFIGHNGLMEHDTLETPPGNGNRDAIVLSCVSDSYFSDRLKGIQVNPVLMTKSLMYPGSFILHDALEGWLRGESKAGIRERAAKAYARNQKISTRGGRSIFASE